MCFTHTFYFCLLIFISFFSFKRRKSPEPESRNTLDTLVADLQSGKVKDIFTMPKCTEAADVTRVPPELPVGNKDNINLDYVSVVVVVKNDFIFYTPIYRTWTNR